MKLCITLFLIGLVVNFQPRFAVQESRTLDEAMDDSTQQMVGNMKNKQKQKIAVIDFSGLEGKTTDMNEFLSEELRGTYCKTI